MQKGSVDLKAIVWLKNPIVLIVLGPYHGSIDVTLGDLKSSYVQFNTPLQEY